MYLYLQYLPILAYVPSTIVEPFTVLVYTMTETASPLCLFRACLSPDDTPRTTPPSTRTLPLEPPLEKPQPRVLTLALHPLFLQLSHYKVHKLDATRRELVAALARRLTAKERNRLRACLWYASQGLRSVCGQYNQGLPEGSTDVEHVIWHVGADLALLPLPDHKTTSDGWQEVASAWVIGANGTSMPAARIVGRPAQGNPTNKVTITRYDGIHKSF